MFCLDIIKIEFCPKKKKKILTFEMSKYDKIFK